MAVAVNIQSLVTVEEIPFLHNKNQIPAGTYLRILDLGESMKNGSENHVTVHIDSLAYGLCFPLYSISREFFIRSHLAPSQL